MKHDAIKRRLLHLYLSTVTTDPGPPQKQRASYPRLCLCFDRQTPALLSSLPPINTPTTFFVITHLSRYRFSFAISHCPSTDTPALVLPAFLPSIWHIREVDTMAMANRNTMTCLAV
jgi:hypothetical protein